MSIFTVVVHLRKHESWRDVIKHYYLLLLNGGFMNKVNIVLERRIILTVLPRASQENTLRFRVRSREDARKIIRTVIAVRLQNFTSESQWRFFDVAMKARSPFYYRANPFNCIFIAALCTARCFPHNALFSRWT